MRIELHALALLDDEPPRFFHAAALPFFGAPRFARFAREPSRIRHSLPEEASISTHAFFSVCRNP